jgi:hypothetical protein
MTCGSSLPKKGPRFGRRPLGGTFYGAPAAEPTVVFVCDHRAAKSVIATAYFNKIAAERGLRARTIYRGTNPQPDLSVRTIKGLQDDGLTVPQEKPSAITSADVEAATVVFAIGCPLPANAAGSGKSANWDDVPEDQVMVRRGMRSRNTARVSLRTFSRNSG